MIREVFGNLNDPGTGVVFLALALLGFTLLIWASLRGGGEHFAKQSRLPLEEKNHE